MSEERSPADRLLDLFVYAPLGVVVTVIEDLPALAEKGRGKVTGQIVVARAIGKMAVKVGKGRLDAARNGGGRHDTQAAPAEGAVVDPHAVAPEPESSPAAADHVAAASAVEDVSMAMAEHSTAEATQGRNGTGPAASTLAIPGYDSLAASQVVQRLAGLTPSELEAVRRYEQATRARRTILGRVAQLTHGADEARA
ncbi:MAG TPA: hypothetical protein VGS21_11735 [Acidimicrobiales bacterium]|nr:hypothetical protein [Acidimicrobiales bacterium]